MLLATSNVNGVRAALRKGMTDWLASRPLDVVTLQEVRAPDEVVQAEFASDWSVAHSESRQKGRSGVAILSRTPVRDVLADDAALGSVAAADTHSGRWIEATVDTAFGPVRVVSAYVHSGEADTPKMDDKYAFLDLMTARLAALAAEHERVVVTGDLNTAHTNDDIKNWKGNLKSAGFLPEERAYLDRWFGAGWVDVHRAMVGQQEGPYTWWSMRGQAFDNDSGWRIDYQLATAALAARAASATVDRQASWDTRWTDHAPLVIEYADRD